MTTISWPTDVISHGGKMNLQSTQIPISDPTTRTCRYLFSFNRHVA